MTRDDDHHICQPFRYTCCIYLLTEIWWYCVCIVTAVHENTCLSLLLSDIFAMPHLLPVPRAPVLTANCCLPAIRCSAVRAYVFARTATCDRSAGYHGRIGALRYVVVIVFVALFVLRIYVATLLRFAAAAAVFPEPIRCTFCCPPYLCLYRALLIGFLPIPCCTFLHFLLLRCLLPLLVRHEDENRRLFCPVADNSLLLCRNIFFQTYMKNRTIRHWWWYSITLLHFILLTKYW